MKMAKHMGALFGSGTFTAILLISFYQSTQPVEVLTNAMNGMPVFWSPMRLLQSIEWAFGGALVMGYLGYSMGNILAHPKGKKKKPVATEESQQTGLPGVALPTEVATEAPEATQETSAVNPG